MRLIKRSVGAADPIRINNFAQGRRWCGCSSKLSMRSRLWPLANFIKTRGKGYAIPEGDGLFYSYSVFDGYPQIAAQCARIHLINTSESGPNIYRSASHVALLGLKS
jgi:hypothetical protein